MGDGCSNRLVSRFDGRCGSWFHRWFWLRLGGSAGKTGRGKSVHFAAGSWSGVAEIGPTKKSGNACWQQSGRVARRAKRSTLCSLLIIGRGSGFAVAISDDKLPAERILDDQAELTVGDRAFPATAFTVRADTLAIHPGDAAGVLTALEKATTLRLRSDGAGVASGAITLDLPSDALAWLKQCGKQFDIALDRPTDPKAGDIPAPRPRAPEIAPVASTAAGPAGIEDKQKISGWDASELRNNDGKVAVCFIRQHYQVGAGANARFIGTFLMVSRAKGLTMMLKDSSLNLPEGSRSRRHSPSTKSPLPDSRRTGSAGTKSVFFHNTDWNWRAPWGMACRSHSTRQSSRKWNFRYRVASCLGCAPAHAAAVSASSRTISSREFGDACHLPLQAEGRAPKERGEGSDPHPICWRGSSSPF